jgi:hypothetical protein
MNVSSLRFVLVVMLVISDMGDREAIEPR